MATTAPDPSALAAAASAPAKGGKRRKLMLIGAALVLVCAAAGAAAYMKWSSGPHVKAVEAVPLPVFFALDSFTVNLTPDVVADDGSDGGGGGSDRYLHIGLTLKLDNLKTQQLLTDHMPEIRSRILLLLSAKHPADLATVAGKRSLAHELVKVIDEPFSPDKTPHPVSDVLFTDFVVQ
jgi:flagellar FliL protein